jgi:hypothetical protein
LGRHITCVAHLWVRCQPKKTGKAREDGRIKIET